MNFRFSILLNLIAFACLGQTDGPITVTGRALDHRGKSTLISVMVVNQASGTGSFANADGSFTITVQKKDTIMITARDCNIRKLCFRDSAYKSTYRINVKLDSLHYDLADVYIYPNRTLPEIHKDIDKLGHIPNTDTYKDVAINNPITLLYERFSRIEKSKRKVAQMEDEETRRKVLKDLFHLYIKYDIIKLSDKDFDSFIDFCKFQDDFIKQSTDYELVMAVKQRYQQYIRQFGNDYR